MAGLSVEDLVSFDRVVGVPVVGDDGQWVVFTRRTHDLTTGKTTTDLWATLLSSSISYQLTFGPVGCTNTQPHWFRGGAGVLFVSNRVPGGNPQVFYINVGGGGVGGEARQVTFFDFPVENLRFVDGNHAGQMLIAFSREVAVGDNDDDGGGGDDYMVFDRLMVRHWDTWGVYRKRQHVFVASLTTTPDSSFQVGEPVDLMHGMDTDCPTKPFGGAEEFAFSPCGRRLAIVARDPDQVAQRELAWTTNTKIFMIDVPELPPPAAGGGGATATTPAVAVAVAVPAPSLPDFQGFHGDPSWSPDGRFLAFTAMRRNGYESDCTSIIVAPVSGGGGGGGATRVVGQRAAFGLSLHGLVWSEDSRRIYATGQISARSRIFRLTLDGDVLEYLPGGHNRGAPTLVGNRALVFSETSLSAPTDLHVVEIDGDRDPFGPFEFLESPDNTKAPPLVDDDTTTTCSSGGAAASSRQLTFVNDARLAEIGEMPTPESFYFPGSKGEQVQAWFVPPVGVDDLEGELAPLVLIIHGGPQGAITDSFHYRWNLQMYAARGFGVLAVNFHGSTGFGHAFTESITGDWGGAPYEDLIAGTRFALERYAYLDGDRVGALGASYGGYMINWLNGHNEDNLFKVLVNHDGLFDLRAMYYSTEEVWFPEWEFGGAPWESRGAEDDQYERWSPSTFVDRWETPCLVIHGGVDYRVCDTEGIATFTALQRRGIPSRMLFFPKENHWVLKPANSVVWHNHVFEWLDQWLR